MKKIILILLILITGCSSTTVQPKPSETTVTTPVDPKPQVKLTDDQITLVEDIIYSSGFFDHLIESTDQLSYDINNYTITVYIENERPFNIKFNMKTSFFYEYNFKPVTIFYEKDSEERFVTITSVANPSLSGKKRLQSHLLVSTSQSFNLMFDKDKELIYDNLDNEINFTSALHNQVLTLYKKQWNEFMEFNSYMQTMFDEFNQIYNNDPNFQLINKSKVILQDVVPEWSDLESNVVTQIETRYMLDFYSVYINDEKEVIKYSNLSPEYRTASLFFFITNEKPTQEELITAFTNTSRQYFCEFSDCTLTDNDGYRLGISQGIISNYAYYYVNKESYHNELQKSVFKDLESLNINETKKYDNGIVTSKEEKTIIVAASEGDSYTPYGLIYNEQWHNDNEVSALVTPYIGKFDTLINQEQYYHLYDSQGNQISTTSMKITDMYNYVVNNLSKFNTWELYMQKSNADKYMQINSFRKIN
ncbi:MAG: hypothetical protein RR571_04950 [Anaerorhabdus sp.]|uniref:hypothetical protein n=2 Tax=Anaerorhabdus sp. TaxID=1872524 RepID=UPI002FC63225